MKKLIFLGACLVALASQPVRAQTGGADIVVVKVFETYGSLAFDIARAGSKPEHRDFTNKELRDKGLAECTRSLLVELAQQGYALTSTYGANGANGGNPATLIFTKRQ